jgi:hypothetical protein
MRAATSHAQCMLAIERSSLDVWPSLGTDVGGVSPVRGQMWEGRAQSRRKCGRGESSPGADVGRGLDPRGVGCARDCAGHRAVRHAACDCSRHVRQLLQEYEMVGTEDCFLWVGLECSEFKFSELVDILIRCVHMQQCCNSTTGVQPFNYFRAEPHSDCGSVASLGHRAPK